MGLKNITRIEVVSNGEDISRQRLMDNEGEYINSFDYYFAWLIRRNYSPATIRRYSLSVARFIDYLFELHVLGQPTSAAEINRAVDQYPMFLKHGNSVNALSQTKILRSFADATGLGSGLARNSFAPTLAAVNNFLRISQALANEANTVARSLDPAIAEDFDVVIKAISGTRTISHFEKKRLMQNTMLGGVIRICGEVVRPLHLQSPLQKAGQIDQQRLDFPLSEISKLLDAATCIRDKALWALLAASGIRMSEALNLRLRHIDPDIQVVYVEDPNFLRFGKQLSQKERLPFKGRATSKTVLFEPLKSVFFNYYEQYLKTEYICTAEHDFVFQVLERTRRGAPLNTASDATLNKSFKKAVVRAGISGPPNQPEKIYTPHSLRHSFGVYMLNYVPVHNGAGLSHSEVQMVMGHRNADSTKHYARHADEILKAKMEFADAAIYGDGHEVGDFSTIIGKRLISAGKAFLEGDKNND